MDYSRVSHFDSDISTANDMDTNYLLSTLLMVYAACLTSYELPAWFHSRQCCGTPRQRHYYSGACSKLCSVESDGRLTVSCPHVDRRHRWSTRVIDGRVKSNLEFSRLLSIWKANSPISMTNSRNELLRTPKVRCSISVRPRGSRLSGWSMPECTVQNP